jgi:cell division protease FtsH
MESKVGGSKLSKAEQRQLEKLIVDSISQNMMDLTKLHAPVQSLADFLGAMYSRVQIVQRKGVFRFHPEAETKKVAQSFAEKFFSEFMKRAYEIATTFSIEVSAGGGAGEGGGAEKPTPEQRTAPSKYAVRKLKPTLRFKDVGGNPEAKKELGRFVVYYKTPGRFKEIGADLPKGILLKGPHGAGKPSLAIAMAGEAGVPVVKIDATDLFAMYNELGSEGMVRAIAALKGDAPLVILVDEILPPSPTGQDFGAVALRALFDGFTKADDVLIVGATSNPEGPDPSLLRHEMFGRVIPVDKPDFKARLEIFRIYTTTSKKVVIKNPRKKLIDKRLDLAKWARDTAGFTPERIENLLNDAAILTVIEEKKTAIGEEEMQCALDRIMEGAGSTRTLRDKEKEIVAVHELGHALVSHFLPNASPIAKISIVGKGEALGYTRPYQREGKYLMSKDMLLDGVATLMGGRLAEELLFPENDKTDGASSDLQVLTELLEYAVTEIGLGNGYVLPDKEHDRAKLRRQVDEMVKESERRALEVLTSHYYELLRLKGILVQKESLTGKEFVKALSKIQRRKKRLSPKQLETEVKRLENNHVKKLSRPSHKAAFLPTQEGFGG